MSHLKKITLTQFRNFNHQSFDLHSPVVGITGINGSGKTNLLDAIYYTCFTKSNFQSRETYNVQEGTTGFRIEAELAGNATHSDVVCCIWKEGKKTISLNGAEYEKVTDHIGKYSAVMVAPDDINLITGSSELRRKFFDGLLALQDNAYFHHLIHYYQNLHQKNAYLKNQETTLKHDLLDIYDQQLAIHGSYLIKSRMSIAEQLPALIKYYYNNISKNQEIPSISYKPSCPPGDLLKSLHQSRWKDMSFKRTLIGPHTEDWQFYINHKSLKNHASQGQKKSFLISLKLTNLRLLQEMNKSPFLLLDDIFEKLDRNRLKYFFEMLGDLNINQIFLTHTHEKDFSEYVKFYFQDLKIIRL